MATQKQNRARRESAAFLAVAAGILVLLNVLGLFAFGRFDITGKRLFSLSDGSKQLVANLDDRLEVVGYFSADLPAPHNATERYVRDLLAEYQAASRGKIQLRFVHPATDEDKQKAEGDGIVRVSDPSYQGDTFSVTEGYMIEDGKITAPIRNVNLIGNGPDVLTKVSAVGHDFKLSDGRWTCGKDGQSVPVGVGIPTVLVSGMTVGGTNMG
jgi:hypothetical protein